MTKRDLVQGISTLVHVDKRSYCTGPFGFKGVADVPCGFLDKLFKSHVVLETT